MVDATPLTVLDNFLGEEISNTGRVSAAFRSMSARQLVDLVEEFRAFEALWAPSMPLGPETMHIGRAYDTFRNPLSWVPKYSEVDKHLDASFLSRLLLYYPRVSVWQPEMPEDFGFRADLNSSDLRTMSAACRYAERLVALRPFLEDGSIQIIPDRFYARTCGLPERPTWLHRLRHAVLASPQVSEHLREKVMASKDERTLYDVVSAEPALGISWLASLSFADSPLEGKILQAARKDSMRSDLRAVLEKIEFIPEDNWFCSDGRYMWGLENREGISFVGPLNEINEDVLVQRELACSTLCANDVMHEVIRTKYEGEVASARDMVWENVSIALPALNEISLEDMVRVRQSEDGFQLWRDTLTKAMRAMQHGLASDSLSAKDIRDIFREEAKPVSIALEAKLKKTSLSSVMKTAGVQFVSGAAAGLLLNPDPVTAVATGAVSSLVRGTLDGIDSRQRKPEEPLIRLFSTLTKTS